MASPFVSFRKNQKVLLAVFGVLIMLAFVLGDPIARTIGRVKGPENPVIVETRFGKLTQSELTSLVQQREIVNAFLQQIVRATVEAQVQKGVVDPRNQMQVFEQIYSFWRTKLLQRTQAAGREESAVDTLVLSKRAEEAGLVVSDDAINALIKQITENSLSSQAIADAIRSLHSGRQMRVAGLFNALRTEMLASEFTELFAQSLSDIPPAQRFEYFARLNRRAKAEVLPLAVADFTSQVKDPTSEELQAFYEANKDRYPDGTSPEPGFKQAKRAAFQYFKADFAQLQEKYKTEVTEAEIQDYYDKNKAQFRAVELPADKDKDEAAAKDEATPGDKPVDGEKPADADKPADEAKPADAPAEKTDASEKPAEPAKEGDKPAAGSPQSRLNKPSATLRFVSTAALVDEPAADAPAAVEKEPAAKETAETDAAAEKPASDEKPAAEKDASATTAETKPEIKYEPLEKVHDSIRDSIAGQKASAKMNEIFDDLNAAMRRYADDMDRYTAGKSTNPALKPPQPFAFAELAKKYGVEAKELPLLTAAEVANEDIGKVRRIVADSRSRFGFRSEGLDEFAFADSLPTYKATRGEDNEGNGYLFWKTQEEASYVPALDKIHDKVVAAWKMIQAREPAMKRANEYALQARSAGKPLKEVFAAQSSLKVAETGPFSWLSIGNVPFDPSAMQPRISQVEGVTNPGDAFMETVFKLAPGEVGAALNHPQDTAYVVQVESYERPLDELRKDYAIEPPMRYLSVALPDQRKIFVAWLQDVNKEAGVHWLRTADTAARRQTGDEAPPDDVDF